MFPSSQRVAARYLIALPTQPEYGNPKIHGNVIALPLSWAGPGMAAVLGKHIAEMYEDLSSRAEVMVIDANGLGATAKLPKVALATRDALIRRYEDWAKQADSSGKTAQAKYLKEKLQVTAVAIRETRVQPKGFKVTFSVNPVELMEVYQDAISQELAHERAVEEKAKDTVGKILKRVVQQGSDTPTNLEELLDAVSAWDEFEAYVQKQDNVGVWGPNFLDTWAAFMLSASEENIEDALVDEYTRGEDGNAMQTLRKELPGLNIQNVNEIRGLASGSEWSLHEAEVNFWEDTKRKLSDEAIKEGKKFLRRYHQKRWHS